MVSEAQIAKKTGALYVVQGDSFLREAAFSAASLKAVHPELPVAIYTDASSSIPEVFDIALQVTDIKTGFGAKIYALGHSPFEQTVFLDTDTYVCGDISALFTLLDRFDVGVAQDPFRAVPYIKVKEVPESFPEPNTGVIAYRSSKQVADLLATWQELYEKQEYKGPGWHDQPTFRRALYLSEAKSVFLPPEYNARIIYPIFVANEVKIIHARSRNLKRIARTMNTERWPRIYSWSLTDVWRVLRTFPLLRWGRGW